MRKLCSFYFPNQLREGILAPGLGQSYVIEAQYTWSMQVSVVYSYNFIDKKVSESFRNYFQKHTISSCNYSHVFFILPLKKEK